MIPQSIALTITPRGHPRYQKRNWRATHMHKYRIMYITQVIENSFICVTHTAENRPSQSVYYLTLLFLTFLCNKIQISIKKLKLTWFVIWGKKTSTKVKRERIKKHLPNPSTTGRIRHKIPFLKFSFYSGCLTKAKEPRMPYYLPITRGTDEFMPNQG